MSDLIQRLDNAGPNDGNLFDLCMQSFVEIERLTAEHKAAELMWWDEKGVLDDRIAELEAACRKALCRDTGYMVVMRELLQEGKP